MARKQKTLPSVGEPKEKKKYKQRNLYLGKTPREKRAEEVASWIESHDVAFKDFVKEVLIQIGEGELLFDPATLRLIPAQKGEQDSDLRGMVAELLKLVKSGKFVAVGNDDEIRASNDAIRKMDTRINSALEEMED